MDRQFRSLDGDSAAAMCYTGVPSRARVADEVLQEIEQETVAFRPSYDGTKSEPVVLPSRDSNLLVNGSTASRWAWPPTSRRTTSTRFAPR
jgi:DNA gyrase subunit A